MFLAANWPCLYFKSPIAVLAIGLKVGLAIGGAILIALEVTIGLLK